jgi:hypothetical protein
MRHSLRTDALQITACALFAGVTFSLAACRSPAESSRGGPSATVAPLPALYAGYSALDYHSKGAPKFAKEHAAEIAYAISREAPIDRPKLRYTMALADHGMQRVFVIFRDTGQPSDTRLRQLYVVLNLRNVNYDPYANTIVAQPPS